MYSHFILSNGDLHRTLLIEQCRIARLLCIFLCIFIHVLDIVLLFILTKQLV